MVNVSNYGFSELSVGESYEIDGGGWFGYAVALALGGPVGVGLYYVYNLSYRNGYNDVYYGNWFILWVYESAMYSIFCRFK